MIASLYIVHDIARNSASPARDYVVSTLTADWALEQLKNNARAVMIGERNFQFIRLPDGTYNAPAGIVTQLVEENGSYVLKEPHGESISFENATINGQQQHRLRSISDVDGNSLTVGYKADGRLDYVTDCYERKLTFSYGTDGRISQITDSTGRSVYYGYDGDGDLIWFQDPTGATSKWGYDYDGRHRMVSLRNPSDEYLTFNIYDSMGRVKQQRSQNLEDHLWNFHYSGFSTIQLDPLGNATMHYFDGKGRQISQRDATGVRQYWRYDGQNHAVRYTDGRGNATEYEYASGHGSGTSAGANNNLLKVYPFPDTDRTLFTETAYDAYNRVQNVYDEQRNRTEYQYDSGSITNRPIKVIQHRDLEADVVREFGYYSTGSDKGLLEWQSDADGNVTYFTYDAYGLPDKVRRGYVVPTGGNPTWYSERDFNYYARGDLGEEFDERGCWSSRDYNARRQLLHTYRGQGIVTENTYDGDGHALTAVAEDGTVIAYDHDSLNRLRKTTLAGLSSDPHQRTMEEQYDRGDRRTLVTDVLGRTTKFGFDGAGRRTSETNGAGETYGFGYDANGNLTSVTNPRNYSKWITYNAWNKIETVCRYGDWGDLTRYEYNNPSDRRPLLWKVTDFTGDVTAFDYDELGRIESQTDPVGTITWQYSNGVVYVGSEKGAKVTITETPVGGGAKSIVKQYDNMGRLYYVSNNGATTYYYYYKNDLLQKIKYPGGREVAYEYDDVNRLTRVVDGSNITSFSYYPQTAPVGQRQKLWKITFPNGTYREFGYRGNGEPWVSRDRKSNGEWITDNVLFFDMGGQLVGETIWPYPGDFQNGIESTPGLLAGYDADNRMSDYNGQSLTFDDDGNMTSGPVPGGGWSSYTYDKRNRLTGAAGAIYTYDAENRRLSRTYSGQTTTFVSVPLFGREEVIRQSGPNGTTDFVYAPGYGLLYQVNGSGLTVYHQDTRGHTIALTRADQGVVAFIQYDPYGHRMIREGSPQVDPEVYPFLYNGGMGVMTEPTELIYMRARYFHPDMRRFFNPDPIGDEGGYNHYLFANGNPVMFSDSTGEWFGWDDLVFAGGGALVGLVTQGVADAFRGELSDWETYAGAAVGGAAYGETLLYTANQWAAGAVGGAVTNGTTQALQMTFGEREEFDYVSFAADTAVGTLTGFIPGNKTASGTYFKGIVTRGWDGNIGAIQKSAGSALTMGEGALYRHAVPEGAGTTVFYNVANRTIRDLSK
jgi:RHS repeat-associated protein